MPSVTQNAAFMASASVVQRLISFAYFAIVASVIGVDNLGKYGVALSAATIFVVFVDFGLTNVLIRDSAQRKENTEANLRTVLGAKLFSGILSYIALIIFAWVLGYDKELMILVGVAGITMLSDSLHLSFYGALRAHGRLKWEAYGVVLSQLCTLILGTLFLFLKLPLVFLMLAFLVPSLLNAMYAGLLVKKKLDVQLLPRISKTDIRRMLTISFPFALAAIFARIYANADVLMVKQFLGDTASGWYQVPYKIAYAFQFVPLAMVAALYPRFSEDFASNKQRLADTFERALLYLLLVSLPIAVGIAILAPDIILTFFPEYAPSIVTLQVLIFSIIFSYVSFPVGSLLNACHKQGHQTAIVGVIMVLNILLNFFLIPKYGVVGAAISTLICNAVLFFLGSFIAHHIVALPLKRFFSYLIRLILATVIMGLVAYLINQETHFILAIVGGTVTYLILLFLLRIITAHEMQMLRTLFKKA